MNINARIFGSDIPTKVKKKLEARQLAAEKTRKPGDQISGGRYAKYDDGIPTTYDDMLHNQFDGEGDISSRTPFARMWTAVELREKIDPESDEAFEKWEHHWDQDTEETSKNKAKAFQFAREANLGDPSDPTRGTDTFGGELYPRTIVVQKDDGTYYLRQRAINAVEGMRKVYILNTNNIGEETKGKSIHDTVLGDDASKQGPPALWQAKEMAKLGKSEGLFPTEHDIEGDENKFLKPAAGITSVRSETEGSLGVIRKTTVTFQVHNFADFENIYMRYFMRPGAQVFVDFGWSNIDIYDPEDIINPSSGVLGSEERLQYLLFDNQVGLVSQYQGDLETLTGLVTNYDSKILPNGSIECVVTMTSKNNTMLQGDLATDRKSRIKFLIDHLLIWEAVYKYSSKDDREQLAISLPNIDTSPADLLEYNKTIKEIGHTHFKGHRGATPGRSSILTGVFWNEMANKYYLSWGLIEDRIFNSEFGFGFDLKTMSNRSLKDKKNFEITLDSSESYTKFEKTIHRMQVVLQSTSVSEGTLNLLSPESWGLSPYEDPLKGGKYDINTKENKLFIDTYNTLLEKRPMSEPDPRYKDIADRIKKEGEAGKTYKAGENMGGTSVFGSGIFPSYTNIDRENGRIPIREMFVDATMIIQAFQGADTCKEAIEKILDNINSTFRGYYDWRIVSAPGDDSSLSIIDYNFLGITSDKKMKQSQVFEKLFVFDVTGKNSIVQGYDLSLTLPEGNVGNMLAIQGLSSTNQCINASSLLDENLAHSSLLGTTDNDQQYITYLPEITVYRAGRMGADNNQNASFNYMYKDIMANLEGPDIGGSWLEDSTNIIENQHAGGMIYETEKAAAKVSEPSKDWEKRSKSDMTELVTLSESILSEEGVIIKSSIKDFYLSHLTQKFFSDKETTGRAVPFNFLKLTLTLYGIASLQPGDIFRVNYLPKIYLKTMYFQVIKVSHDITPTGWITVLETQFRVRADKKNTASIAKQSSPVVLSANTVDKFESDPLKSRGRDSGINTPPGIPSIGKQHRLAHIKGFMTKVEPYTPDWMVQDSHCKISHAFQFQCNHTITQDDGFWEPMKEPEDPMYFCKDWPNVNKFGRSGILFFPMDHSAYLLHYSTNGQFHHHRELMDRDFSGNGHVIHYADGVHPVGVTGAWGRSSSEKGDIIGAAAKGNSTHRKFLLYGRKRVYADALFGFYGHGSQKERGDHRRVYNEEGCFPLGFRIQHAGYGSAHTLNPGYFTRNRSDKHWKAQYWARYKDDIKFHQLAYGDVFAAKNGLWGLDPIEFGKWPIFPFNGNSTSQYAEHMGEHDAFPETDSMTLSKSQQENKRLAGPDAYWHGLNFGSHRMGTNLIKGRMYILLFNTANPSSHWIIVDKEELEKDPKLDCMNVGTKDTRTDEERKNTLSQKFKDQLEPPSLLKGKWGDWMVTAKDETNSVAYTYAGIDFYDEFLNGSGVVHNITRESGYEGTNSYRIGWDLNNLRSLYQNYWEGSATGWNDAVNTPTEYGRGGDGYNVSIGDNAPGLLTKIKYTYTGQRASYALTGHLPIDAKDFNVGREFNRITSAYVKEQWWQLLQHSERYLRPYVHNGAGTVGSGNNPMGVMNLVGSMLSVDERKAQGLEYLFENPYKYYRDYRKLQDDAYHELKT